MAKKKAAAPATVNDFSTLEKELFSIGLAPIRKPVNPSRVSSGILGLDFVLGGGWPMGEAILLVGDPGTGKTTISLYTAATAINAGMRVAYVDVENRFSAKRAADFGVPEEAFADGRFYLVQPFGAEQGWNAAAMLAQSGLFHLLIYDSIGANSYLVQQQGEITDKNMGNAGFINKAGLNKLIPWVKKNQVAVILINHLQDKLGVVTGDSEYIPGGKAQLFRASAVMKMLKPEAYRPDPKDSPAIWSGAIYRFNFKKKKPTFAYPAQFVDMHTEDFFSFRFIDFVKDAITSEILVHSFSDSVYDAVKISKKMNLFTRKDGSLLGDSSHMYFEGVVLGNGEDNACATLWQDEGLRNRVITAVQARIIAATEDMPMVAHPEKIEWDDPDYEEETESEPVEVDPDAVFDV